jgi:hypothetical protein
MRREWQPEELVECWTLRDSDRRLGITKLVNATLQVRDSQWWGEATAYAVDSKQFGSWSSNVMTEWHAR